jgi:hypothetical protein
MGDGDNIDFLTSFLENFHDLSLFEENAADLAVLDTILVDLVESTMQSMPHVAGHSATESSAMTVVGGDAGLDITADAGGAAPTTADHADESVSSLAGCCKPAPILFQVISEGIGTRLRNNTPDIIRERYDEIKGRDVADIAASDGMAVLTKSESAHGAAADTLGAETAAQSADPTTGDHVCYSVGVATDSYRSLLCRMCCIYECCFHRVSPVSRPIQNGARGAPPLAHVSDSDAAPCTRGECFRHSLHGPKGVKTPTPGAPWMDEEMALVETAITVFSGADPCNIAAFVGSRTCLEVYEYLSSTGKLVVSSVLPAQNQEYDSAHSAVGGEQSSPMRGRKRSGGRRVPVESGARRDESTVKGRIFAPPLKSCDHTGPCGKGCVSRTTSPHPHFNQSNDLFMFSTCTDVDGILNLLQVPLH